MKLGLICQHSALERVFGDGTSDIEARWTIPPAGDEDQPWTPLPPSVGPASSPPPASGPRLVVRRPPVKGRKPQSQRAPRPTARPRAA